MRMSTFDNGRVSRTSQPFLTVLFSTPLTNASVVVLPDPPRLQFSPRRQRIDPLLAGAKRRRRPRWGDRKRAGQLLEDGGFSVVATLKYRVCRKLGLARNRNWHRRLDERRRDQHQASRKLVELTWDLSVYGYFLS